MSCYARVTLFKMRFNFLKVFWFLTSSAFMFVPHKDFGLNITQLSSKYGYPIETYRNVPTEDGYLLTLFRLPCRKRCDALKQTSIFLMHGFIASAENWLLKSEKSLAFLLADNGFDVWLGNARGNRHSRRHKTLNPDTDEEFWNFSYHEIGVYDLSAQIDFVISKTGRNEMFYLGHSQGTTSYFVLMSEKPEYNRKIKLMVAYAPIVFMGHCKQPVLRYLSRYQIIIQRILGKKHIYETFPFRKVMWKLNGILCSEKSVIAILCMAAMYAVVGFDWQQNDLSSISLIASLYPDDVSFKQIIHYGQNIRTGTFRQYNYEPKENLRRYHQIKPPDYDLSKIESSIVLFNAKNDLLSDVLDVNILKSKLKSLSCSYLIPYKYFNHFDFLIALETADHLYNQTIALLHQYNENSTCIA